jgi:hypothetical protein
MDSASTNPQGRVRLERPLLPHSNALFDTRDRLSCGAVIDVGGAGRPHRAIPIHGAIASTCHPVFLD